MNHPDLLDDIAKKVNSFPSMPGPAFKVLALLGDPDSEMDLVEENLRYDPGLTANILKLTNSSYFALPRTVGSVRQAAVLLGRKRMMKVVMVSCVAGLMGGPLPGYDMRPGELWRHSVAVSVAAEDLLRDLKISIADEVMTAGLLHDVGKLILGGYVQDKLSAIEEETGRGFSFDKAEQRVLGTDHAQVGAFILQKWALPAPIVDAVRHHHDPEMVGPKGNPAVDVVHAADLLCRMMGIGGGRVGLHSLPSFQAIRRLGVTTVHLERVASRTLQWVNELSDLIGLDKA